MGEPCRSAPPSTNQVTKGDSMAVTQSQTQLTTHRAHRRHMSDGTLVKLFIMPTLILLILWNVFPLFYSLYLSFTNYVAIANQPPQWIGVNNYTFILQNDRLWQSFA